MPANKLQHYVPRCYLRPFCVDERGAAINVFNIGRGIGIKGAPTKGQCARPYFYGKDGELEKALQEPEGRYSELTRKAEAAPKSLSTDDLVELRTFMMLQTFRSAAWVDRQQAELSAQRELFREEATEELLAQMTATNAEVVKLGFEMLRKILPTVGDLDVCILVNETAREFFTSDDPVVHTNRYHVQKRLLGGFGFTNSGAMLFMPMTPRLFLVAFDPYIYKLEGRSGQVARVMDVREIDSLNQLQVIHAHSNLYFRSWNQEMLTLAAYNRGKSNRQDRWFALEILQETAFESGEFVPVKGPLESDPKRRELLHMEQVLPRPDRWPGILPIKLRPKFVDTGTGAGLRRPTPHSPHVSPLQKFHSRAKI